MFISITCHRFGGFRRCSGPESETTSQTTCQRGKQMESRFSAGITGDFHIRHKYFALLCRPMYKLRRDTSRQFRDAARERYFKDETMSNYFHSSIADYFLGIWGGGNPKPFKYTEIQRHRFNLQDKEGAADRKVPLQPLAFTGKDGKISRYNLRKVTSLAWMIWIRIRVHSFNLS